MRLSDDTPVAFGDDAPTPDSKGRRERIPAGTCIYFPKKKRRFAFKIPWYRKRLRGIRVWHFLLTAIVSIIIEIIF